MLYYSVAAAGLIGLLSMLLVYILKKLGLPSFRIVITTGISSIAVSLLFPIIYNAVSASGTFAGNGFYVNNSFGILVAISLIAILIISFAALLIIPESTFLLFDARLRGNEASVADAFTADAAWLDSTEERALNEPIIAEDNYPEDILEKMGIDNQKETDNFAEHTADNIIDNTAYNMEYNDTKNESNIEKLIDSGKNTDKIGTEYFEMDNAQIDNLSDLVCDELSDEPLYEAKIASVDVTDSKQAINVEAVSASELQPDNMTIEDCLNEAFRLKETGDFESAILYFMYALDRKPQKDLVFWIVLDICVLYKELNRAELAKDILTGYIEKYSDLMPDDVRMEIENNLLYI